MTGTKKFKFMEKSQDERKAQALAEGIRGQWFCCLLCGFSRKLDIKAKGRIRFDNVDLKKGFILQERAGGGAIRGWYRDDSESMTLPELIKDPNYHELLQQIRKRCLEITAAIK